MCKKCKSPMHGNLIQKTGLQSSMFGISCKWCKNEVGFKAQFCDTVNVKNDVWTGWCVCLWSSWVTVIVGQLIFMHKIRLSMNSGELCFYHQEMLSQYIDQLSDILISLKCIIWWCTKNVRSDLIWLLILCIF